MLDAEYWSTRYREGTDGWDIGAANEGLLSEPTKRVGPEARILIPGAGRGYEAQSLWSRGYEDVYVCDWSEEAFVHLRDSPFLPDADRLIVADFFELAQPFDALLEQTFFCAIDAASRTRYVEHSHALLVPGGVLVGVLFDREFGFDATTGERSGPPFGGSLTEYEVLFTAKFRSVVLRTFGHSIRARLGSELLVVATKS